MNWEIEIGTMAQNNISNLPQKLNFVISLEMINDNPHADLNPTPKQSTEFNYTGNIFYLDYLHS